MTGGSDGTSIAVSLSGLQPNVEYVASWLRPQETHLLAVPREVVRELPERLQELLGYNVYPPFLGYVDGRHPRRLLEVDATE